MYIRYKHSNPQNITASYRTKTVIKKDINAKDKNLFCSSDKIKLNTLKVKNRRKSIVSLPFTLWKNITGDVINAIDTKIDEVVIFLEYFAI